MFKDKKIIKLSSCLAIGIFILFISVLSVQAGDKININTASQEELESLNGIGPTKAAAIIEYREQNGDFETIEDIMQVKGIGEATFNKIKNDITVGDGENSPSEATQIVINELLPNPAGSDETEWIELKNIGNKEVNLKGWKISDASKSYIINNELLLAPSEFLVISRKESGLALNNSGGETVSLFNVADELVNQTSYNEAAKEDISWARNNEGDYAWTSQLTPGEENQFVDSQTADENKGSAVKNERQSRYKGIIVLSEILPNPVGLDDDEWLELYNQSSQAVSLDGWQLKTKHSQYKFKAIQFIKAHSYLLLSRKMTGLRLMNLIGDEIKLIDRLGWEVDSTIYEDEAPEGQSYNWCPESQAWLWLEEKTPGEANACPVKNDLPVAYFESSRLRVGPYEYFVLDASESYDDDGEVVSYKWNFEPAVNIMGREGKEFIFSGPRITVESLTAGQQQIILTVTDNLGGTAEYKLVLNQLTDKQIGQTKKIYINKFLPNPDGTDEAGEWIELCSAEDKDINLLGYWLDDSEGGSASKNLADYILPAEGCLTLYRSETGVALNNNQDKVRLLFNKQVIDEADYQQAKAGEVYVKTDKGWQVLNNQPVGIYGEDNKNDYYELNNLSALNDMQPGSKVGIVGKVTAEPGLLGANIFYVADQYSGAQIYNYQKDFPVLSLGDLIHIKGVFSLVNNMKRIKITGRKAINFIAHEPAAKPKEIQLDEISEDELGNLVAVQGELTEIKGNSWWLDDGTDEIRVYIKINSQIKDPFQLSDKLKVVGILDKYKDAFRLLPRDQADIKLLGRVLGKEDSQLSNYFQHSQSVSKRSWLDYILILAVGIIIILISWLIKYRRQIKINIAKNKR